MQLGRLRKLLRERDLDLELTPEARTFLGDQGYDPPYGARPLKRAICATCRTRWPKLPRAASSTRATRSWSNGRRRRRGADLHPQTAAAQRGHVMME